MTTERTLLAACIRLAKSKLEEAEAQYDIARGDLDCAAEELQEAQRVYELFQKQYIKSKSKKEKSVK